jgi:hypothetical protein
MGLNYHPNPRTNGKAWEEAYAALKRGQHRTKREQYIDQGRGTLQDGYTRDQLIACLEGLWQNGSEPAAHRAAPPHRVRPPVRPHHAPPGHSTRAYQLPDLFILDFETEGSRRVGL